MLLQMVAATGRQIWQKAVNVGLDMKPVLTRLSPWLLKCHPQVMVANTAWGIFLLRAFSPPFTQSLIEPRTGFRG